MTTDQVSIACYNLPDHGVDQAKILEAAALAVYHPPKADVRDYPLEFERQENGKFFLGVSTLVKSSACDLAMRVGQRIVEEEEDSVYAEVGNLVAEWHLRNITPHREIQLRAPIDDDFDIVGHADGISLHPFGIVVHEAKHQDPDDEGMAGGKVDLAQRQATIYLGMVDAMLKAGHRQFEPNRKFATAESQAFTADGSEAMWGVQVHFCPRTGPTAYTRATPLDAGSPAAALGHYLAKARAVLVSVRAMWGGMGQSEAMAIPGGSLSWDLGVEGIQEFRLTPRAAAVGLDNDDMLSLCLHHKHAALQEKRWGAIKDAVGARACAKLAQAGQKSVEVEGHDGKVWAKPTSATASSGRSVYLRPNLRIGETVADLSPLISERPLDQTLVPP